MYNFTLTVSLHYLMKLKADEIVSDTFMYYDDSFSARCRATHQSVETDTETI